MVTFESLSHAIESLPGGARLRRSRFWTPWSVIGAMLLVKVVKYLRQHMRARHTLTRFEHTDLHIETSAQRQSGRYGINGHRLFSEFFSNAQGLWIFTRRWLVPEGTDVKGIVLLVHGFGEHSGRYDLVGKTLAARGFAVHTLDHQGHGRSEGDRAYCERFSHMVDDVITLGKRAVAEHSATLTHKPTPPVFLFGHSMGGLISTLAAARADKEIPGGLRGCVLSSPALMPDPKVASPMLLTVGRVLSTFLPKAPLDPLPGQFVSRDPVVVEQYKNDPLNYGGGLRARVGIEMVDRMHDVQTTAAEYKWPMLLLQAGEDRLVFPPGATKFAAAKGGDDNTFEMLPGLFHEILNEPEGNEVLDKCIDWMLERV